MTDVVQETRQNTGFQSAGKLGIFGHYISRDDQCALRDKAIPCWFVESGRENRDIDHWYVGHCSPSKGLPGGVFVVLLGIGSFHLPTLLLKHDWPTSFGFKHNSARTERKEKQERFRSTNSIR
ncbi:hypothetical protein ACLOJK_010176 [Asimina triloba]